MKDQTQLPFFSAGRDLPLFSGAGMDMRHVHPDDYEAELDAPTEPPLTRPKTLADLLKTEAHLLELESPRAFVYSSFPYPCGMTEALAHAKRHVHPTSQQLTITRKPAMTRIQIKPRKGTGKRKLLTVRLWVTR